MIPLLVDSDGGSQLGPSSKRLAIADASAHVVAEGGGQMALFLSASALQGYKPVVYNGGHKSPVQYKTTTDA